MAQDGMEFWERHSLNFLEMAFQTDRRERLDHPDGYGKAVNACGDVLEIFLTIEGETIRSAAFDVEGCLYSVACANAAVTLAEGKGIEEAKRLSARDVVEYLETLPPEEEHCADLAMEALRDALQGVPKLAH